MPRRVGMTASLALFSGLVLAALPIGHAAGSAGGQPVEPGGGHPLEANKAVVRRYVECFNAGDLEALRALFSDDAQVHGVLGWGRVDDVMPIWRQLVEGLAMRLEIEEILAGGEMVAVRYRESGRARAPFFGKPATGKSYELMAMEWFVVRDGRIHRRWGARDAASQAQQLGWDVPATRADVDTA